MGRGVDEGGGRGDADLRPQPSTHTISYFTEIINIHTPCPLVPL